MTDLKLVGKLTDAAIGNNNRGIYSVAGTFEGRRGEDLLVKAMDLRAADNWSEVRVLKILGELVASGVFRDTERRLKWKGPKGGGSVPVIVMEKKPGVLIEKTEAYRKASKKVQKEMVEQVRDLMCAEVADIAVTTGVYHE